MAFGTGKSGGFGLSDVGFNDIGGAAQDLFAGFGDAAKAQMDLAEQGEYTLASQYATEEAQYTGMATRIKQALENRTITQALGRTQAAVGGAGFAESGSAIDLMRSGAQQGALAQAAIGAQGQIQQAGYEEQAQSFQLMASAAGKAADAEDMAEIGSFAGAAIKGVASLAAFGAFG